MSSVLDEEITEKIKKKPEPSIPKINKISNKIIPVLNYNTIESEYPKNISEKKNILEKNILNEKMIDTLPKQIKSSYKPAESQNIPTLLENINISKPYDGTYNNIFYSNNKVAITNKKDSNKPNGGTRKRIRNRYRIISSRRNRSRRNRFRKIRSRRKP